MYDEHFEEKCATAADIDACETREVLELTIDELSFVAGGFSWGAPPKH